MIRKIWKVTRLILDGDIKSDLMFLQPYRLVKDLRNNYENTNPDKVLDGDINDFLENSLFKLKS